MWVGGGAGQDQSRRGDTVAGEGAAAGGTPWPGRVLLQKGKKVSWLLSRLPLASPLTPPSPSFSKLKLKGCRPYFTCSVYGSTFDPLRVAVKMDK